MADEWCISASMVNEKNHVFNMKYLLDMIGVRYRECREKFIPWYELNVNLIADSIINFMILLA